MHLTWIRLISAFGAIEASHGCSNSRANHVARPSFSKRYFVIFKILLLIYTGFIVNACATPGGLLYRIVSPRLQRLPMPLKAGSWILDKFAPKDAPLIVQKGWRDGCQSGLYTMGGNTYERFWYFNQDPALRKDTNYYRNWKDAYTFCRHYIYGYVRLHGNRSDLITKQGSGGIGGSLFPRVKAAPLFKAGLFTVSGNPENTRFFKGLEWPIKMDTWDPTSFTSGAHMNIANTAVAGVLDFRKANLINEGSALGGINNFVIDSH